MPLNGRFPSYALRSIPSGRLAIKAAAAWNSGPAKAGLRPLGSNSSYRTYTAQVYYWNLYLSGRGNLAARPGTSNHGWGNAVDLAAPWMRSWINAHGAHYGWRKVEAPNEWWHVNYVGGFAPTRPADPLKNLTSRERLMAHRLQYHRREYRREARTGKGPRYEKQYGWAKYWRSAIEKHMNKLKSDARQTGWNKDNRAERYKTLKRVLG